MALQAEDMYEELGFDEAEGAAESFEEEDGFEEMDAADEFEEMDAADEDIEPIIVDAHPEPVSDQAGGHGIEYLAERETAGGCDAHADLLIVRRASVR